jgi:hypothetical protein
MDDNVIQFAGDISINSVLIKSYTGLELEVKDTVQRIDIYEDLFSPFVTAEITIVDTNDIIGKMPIIGEEIVILDVSDGTGLGYIQKPMFIYKAKERTQVSDRSVSFTLCCISIEAVIDMNLKISKAYSGQPSDIVKNIIKKEGLTSDLDVACEPTRNSVQFISNYWSPIQIIKFLCDRSISASNQSPSYIFYENVSGFNFVSLDFLVSQNANSKFSYSNSKNNDIGASLERIRNLYIDEEFDYISRLENGMYGNRLLLINPTSKTYHYKYVDFEEQYKKYSRLNTNPITTSNSTRRINSNLVTKTSPSSVFKGMQTDGLSQWYQQRKIELSTRCAQSKQIDVPGRFNIGIGQVTDLYIYSEAQEPTESGTRDLYSILDKVHSGRHLITSVHRIINRDRGHTMALELSKDSLI